MCNQHPVFVRIWGALCYKNHIELSCKLCYERKKSKQIVVLIILLVAGGGIAAIGLGISESSAFLTFIGILFLGGRLCSFFHNKNKNNPETEKTSKFSKMSGLTKMVIAVVSLILVYVLAMFISGDTSSSSSSSSSSNKKMDLFAAMANTMLTYLNLAMTLTVGWKKTGNDLHKIAQSII